MSQNKTAVQEFLGQLETDAKLVRRLKLGKTYEARLASALKDPKMRAYIEGVLNVLPGLNTPLEAKDLPEGMLPLEAVQQSAGGVIKGLLVEKAMWEAKNPGKQFPGYE